MEITTTNKVFLSILIAIHQFVSGYVVELPQVPTGKRAQYYVLDDSGAYKYGYDTGADSFAKQSADSANQVEGEFGYRATTGDKIDLKYTSGVQGFIPYSVNHYAGPPLPPVFGYHIPVYTYHQPVQHSSPTSYHQATDGGYSFSYATNDQGRQESGDSSNNVQGDYWYINEAGKHDLRYVAGSSTGFQPVGGSLSVPTGLSVNAMDGITEARIGKEVFIPSTTPNDEEDETTESPTEETPGDASYNFSIDTDEYTRHESSDASGNVHGRYSYKSKDGTTYDLTYKAGSQTGFLATGGNLAPEAQHPQVPEPQDGSYRFSIDTPEYQRHESVDASGNLKGNYAYKNQAGKHDLFYEAGPETGFLPTGGSLKNAPGVVVQHGIGHETTQLVDGVLVKTILPPEKIKKYGYTFQSTK